MVLISTTQKYMKIWDVHARNPPCSLLSQGILNIKSTGWTFPIRIFSFWIQDFPDCNSISNDTRKIEFLDYADPVYELLIEMEKDLFSQDCLEYNFSVSKTNCLWTPLWVEAHPDALPHCFRKSYHNTNFRLHMSHFSYSHKMRCPLNLVLENWEYLWFY